MWSVKRGGGKVCGWWKMESYWVSRCCRGACMGEGLRVVDGGGYGLGLSSMWK